MPERFVCTLVQKVVSDIAIFVLKRDVKLQLTNWCKKALYKYSPFPFIYSPSLGCALRRFSLVCELSSLLKCSLVGRHVWGICCWLIMCRAWRCVWILPVLDAQADVPCRSFRIMLQTLKTGAVS